MTGQPMSTYSVGDCWVGIGLLLVIALLVITTQRVDNVIDVEADDVATSACCDETAKGRRVMMDAAHTNDLILAGPVGEADLLRAKVEQLQAVIDAQTAIIDWHEAHTQYTPEVPALGVLKHALKTAQAKAGE